MVRVLRSFESSRENNHAQVDILLGRKWNLKKGPRSLVAIQ